MDDFFSEMRPFLDDSSSSAQQVSDRQERALRMGAGGASAPSYGVVESYAPGLFADALLPVNPRHLPAYYAGSIAGPSDPDTSLLDRLTMPYNNLIASHEYLATSHSDVQYRDRVYQFAQDTALINSMCELGEGPGAFAAGAYANQIATRYTHESVDCCFSLNPQEKLNSEIFKTVAVERGIDPNTIRGTGAFREYVPREMRGDLCDRPPRNARPNGWNDDSGGSGGSGSGGFGQNTELHPDGIIVTEKDLNKPGQDSGSVFEATTEPSFFSRLAGAICSPFENFFGNLEDGCGDGFSAAEHTRDTFNLPQGGRNKDLDAFEGGGINLGKDMYHDYCMPSSMVMFCDQLPSSPGDGGG